MACLLHNPEMFADSLMAVTLLFQFQVRPDTAQKYSTCFCRTQTSDVRSKVWKGPAGSWVAIARLRSDFARTMNCNFEEGALEFTLVKQASMNNRYNSTLEHT